MADSANLRLLCCSFYPSFELYRRPLPNLLLPQRPFSFSGKIRGSGSILWSSSGGIRIRSVCCLCKTNLQIENVAGAEERPPFDINLAVILAGFAFEAYYTPPENVGRYEIDAGGCKTMYLSESFVREIYDGQLFIKLKKGFNFPAMDPWGTSDPYVVMQLGGQVVKSKVKWGTKHPTWNEELTFNIKQPPADDLQVAAWDANLVTPHKRMGNSAVNLECLCDGNLHEMLVELEGMGGGGKITLEVKYSSFEEIEEDKSWWRAVPFVSEFLKKIDFDSAAKMLVGSETVQVRQFVQYAFSQLKSLNNAYLKEDWFPNSAKHDTQKKEEFSNACMDTSLLLGDDSVGFSDNETCSEGANLEVLHSDNSAVDDVCASSMPTQVGEATQSNKHFWKNFSDAISQILVEKPGKPVLDKMKWDGFDLLNKIGIQLGRDAEASYIESGLATPSSGDPISNNKKELESITLNIGGIHSSLPIPDIKKATDDLFRPSLPDIKKATDDLLRQTDSIFGALMVLAAAVPQLNKESRDVENSEIVEGGSEKVDDDVSGYLKSDQLSGLDERRAEEMKALFSTAETAMEAWTMLATSLGHPSFIKSEFEKICFLDNSSTDTQVAIWRDSTRKRLVVAFRGTEQVRWKDLRTDLMLAPAGLNPERIGGDFKQEVQVHSGFLSAYDSVRTRIMSLIQQAIGYKDYGAGSQSRWHVYVTGHSLGGALATLLALDLSSSQVAKSGAISVTMYNFGSPRVGNKLFAEVYNEKVKDSWRVMNHRDIIPTVPRLMGYCHVAQPVYLAAGDLRKSLENVELSGDGYDVDVIGESTPDVIVNEFMKGEKELIEKILQTEINIFRSIRDGSALMQHMEDFYYITLLENVRANYQVALRPLSKEDSLSVS
ncbi:hypothetical protein Nepgr_020603 [Nepenthes gracilis]|uniref:C2 domain-containing protein n=1 Tax=Nepenthes gracilis TaxID=150966 RepID=A0AAD3XV76_NEPGR|nr:hypothetical protein Nepgr_020603 [Nepenthes gracilis]